MESWDEQLFLKCFRRYDFDVDIYNQIVCPLLAIEQSFSQDLETEC